MDKIWEWFNYQVFSNEDWTVTKIPRKVENNKLDTEKKSYGIHKEHLGTFLAKSEFIGDETWKYVEKVLQEEIKNAKVIDLRNTTNKVVIKLLELWSNMQEKEKILFDIFWLEWMISLFNYYFEWTILKKISDTFLPINSIILEKTKWLPVWYLKELNEKEKAPFLAYNLLENENWEVFLIDTDYRPLTFLNPINIVWKWITNKALKSLQKEAK
jgi:hypothetical protein